MKDTPAALLNHPVDVSRDFAKLENPLFFADKVARFDARSASGELVYRRHAYLKRLAFNQEGLHFAESDPWEFPPQYFGKEETLPFSIAFVGPRTLRLRFASRAAGGASRATGARRSAEGSPGEPSLMLTREPRPLRPWKTTRSKSSVRYDGPFGSVTVAFDPLHIEFRDGKGNLLTRTQHLSDTRSLRNSDPIPFGFTRAAPDYRRQFGATFSLAPDEKLFGGGESFTRLDKRGQRLMLSTYDAHGAQTGGMYKPIPFFTSSRGYGMFLHSSAPAVFDFGASYDGATTIFSADGDLDLFVFLGEPKETLSAYTELTGRSPVPPLWSFGLWMSRCTYKSEDEARAVATELRRRRIPSDVIHLDTGWFEDDWRCDYRFSTTRFADPAKMIGDLKEQGFRISLWQLPYFTPKNRLFREIVDRGYAVRDGRGGLPTDDAILDFSNPAAVTWYQKQLAGLLEMGVGAIKVDFGEAAPWHGVYASGRTGLIEHNLYPLRYNKAVADVTRETTGESIIWARCAWAGSQRYPLHWGGDPEDTDNGMAASLRAGLSLGLCGFSFWSHDIGGFVHPPSEDLYRRWLPFGMLTSHSRCHGVPPREPWAYGDAFVKEFRRAVELKYRLLPYVYAQAHDAAARGFPMLRSLFFEYPNDPTSWLIEDEYLFGSDLLVAPLMQSGKSRRVYLPPGGWIDYQTGELYQGGAWHEIPAKPIAAVMLVRDGALLPHVPVAESTGAIDWQKLTLVAFASRATTTVEGLVRLPDDDRLRPVRAQRVRGGWTLVGTGATRASKPSAPAGKPAARTGKPAARTGTPAARTGKPGAWPVRAFSPGKVQ